MRQRYSEVGAAGGEVVAVGFAPIEQLRAQAEELDLPFPLLHDPELRAYRAFGLGRGSRWTVYGPRTIWNYLMLMLRGRRFRPATVDPYQLGGDFVIDGDGVVRLAHRSGDPSDRPTVAQLVDALLDAAGPASP